MLKTFTSLAASLLVCGVALAAPARAESERAVHYHDLDLGSPAGQKTLTARLRWAVRAVCGEPSPQDLRGMLNNSHCRRAVSEQAASAAERAIALHEAHADRLATRR